MKKEYISPVTKAIFISHSCHLLIVGNSYNVNEYEDGGTIDIGGEEDDPYTHKKGHKQGWEM